MKLKVLKVFTLLAMAVPLMSCGGHTHQAVESWTSDANNHWHACSVEGCQEKLDSAAHSWNEGTVTKQATCTEKGSKEFECTVCHYKKTEEIQAFGHSAKATWEHDDDYHWHNCDHAGCSEKVGYAAHTWNSGDVKTEPTCTEPGVKELTCTQCGFKKDTVINPLGHDFNVPNYVWASDGSACVANTSCKRQNCTHSVVEEGVITSETLVNPTCAQFGEKKCTATFTKAPFTTQTKTVQLEKLEHDYNAPVAVWTPVQEGGYSVTISKSCKNCTDVVSATALTVEVTEEEASTCTVAGHKTYTAIFSEESGFSPVTKTDELPLAPHTTGDWEHDASKHWHICSECSGKVDEANHTFVNGECSVCGEQRVYSSIKSIVESTDTSKKITTVGYVAGIYKNQSYRGIFIADGDRSIQVFGHNNNNLEIGDIIEVIGADYTRDSSNRYIELVSPTAVNKLTAEPSFFNIDEPVNYEIGADWSTCTKSIDNNVALNRPVEFEGTLLTRPDEIKKGSNNTLTGLDKSGQTVTIYIKSDYCADNVYEEFEKLAVGDKFKVSGIVGTYKGSTQLICPSVPTLIAGPVATIKTGAETSYYYNMKDAVAAVPTTGEQTTIELLKDYPDGEGIIVNEGQNIVFDLNGHTYTVHQPAVGSSGTETLGFQLLKGSTVKIKDGTIDCFDTTGSEYEPVERDRICTLIQNYSNLSLENATIDHRKGKDAMYAVSNNFGSLDIDSSSKIYAANGQRAFDMWFGMSPVYEDGICVSFPSDEAFEANIVGKIEYGHSGGHSATYDANWFNRTVAQMDGKNYTVNNASTIAKGSVNSYNSFSDFKDDLTEILVVLTSISVNSVSVKKEYKVGETFTTAGLVVTASYDDGSSKLVTNYETDLDGKTFALEDMSASKTVTVSYTEGEVTKTGTYDIVVKDCAITTDEVRALEAAGTTETIQGNVIAISKKAFVVADATGLMQVWMNGAPTVTMDKYVRVTGKTEDRSGARQLTNTPTIADGIGTDPQIKPTAVEMTTEQWDDANIISEGPVLVKGVVEVYSTGTGYNFYYLGQGESLETTARATNTGYNYQATTATDFCVAGNEGKFFDVVGVVVQTSSSNNRCFMPISFENHKIPTTSIDFKINGGTEAVSLKPGETATLSAVCNPSGASQEVEYVVTGKDGIVSIDGNTLTAVSKGDVTVKAKQGTLYSEAEITVSVEDVTVESIAISGDMTKKSYSVGDAWDPSGLTVTATYSDSSTADVTDQVEWSYNPENADATATTSVAVTASYGGRTDTEYVAVTVVSTVTDVLNEANLELGTSYATFTGKKINTAVYAGLAMKKGGTPSAIQLKAKDNSGIVTTTSGGNVKSVSIGVHSGTASGRSIEVYASNTAYTSAADLYDDSTKGTLIGTINCSSPSTISFSANYKYVAIKAVGGAIYLTSVTIVWG